MANVEEHVSPDGRLRFLVVADRDGDLALGFDGYPWHTHADILAALSGLDETEAVRRYVHDLLNDKSVVALWGPPARSGTSGYRKIRPAMPPIRSKAK